MLFKNLKSKTKQWNLVQLFRRQDPMVIVFNDEEQSNDGNKDFFK